jgi:peptidyl-prolyl cis-trans isomerase C
MPPRIVALVALVALALLASACSDRAAAPQGQALARGKGVVVTEGDLRAKLDEQSSLARAYDGSIERKKDLLESVIRFELLAKEAEEQGLDRDPEVRAALKRIMVQKLVRRALGERGPAHGAVATPETRLSALEAHVGELRARAEIRIDELALSKLEMGGAPRPGLQGHSAVAQPPPAAVR